MVAVIRKGPLSSDPGEMSKNRAKPVKPQVFLWAVQIQVLNWDSGQAGCVRCQNKLYLILKSWGRYGLLGVCAC